jgi:tetratricopeptide (TPR) repeat protein
MEARTLSNKALILEEQGDLDAAVETTLKALMLYGETGDQVAEGITLLNLAGLYGRQNRFAEARVNSFL